MSSKEEKSEFWNNILLAVETKPRDVKSILGASGYSHPVVALGIDENRKRAVMISGESDARSAALAQGDIQAAMPSVKVVMARPLAVNLGLAATLISGLIGKTNIGQEEIEWIGKNKDELKKKIDSFSKEIKDSFDKIFVSPFAATSLNLIAVIKDAIQQLSLIEVTRLNDGSETTIPSFDLSRLKILDPAEADRYMGVCSIPLYEFNEADVERLKSKIDTDSARELLHQFDIIQYFFPAADQLAMGFVDHGTASVADLVDKLSLTPKEGHPFGSVELVDKNMTIDTLIPALKEMGLVVEGELGLEVSPEGTQYRAKVMFRPREGLINKLSRIFSVKMDISLRDLFK